MFPLDHWPPPARSGCPVEVETFFQFLPLYHRYNISESEFTMTHKVPDVAPAARIERERDSLLMRRVIGGAFILGLVVLGFALPVLI
jgi:hypothetical protein